MIDERSPRVSLREHLPDEVSNVNSSDRSNFSSAVKSNMEDDEDEDGEGELLASIPIIGAAVPTRTEDGVRTEPSGSYRESGARGEKLVGAQSLKVGKKEKHANKSKFGKSL